MIVVVTGTVGIDKKSYLEQVCQLASEKGKSVILCNVGDMMYAEAPDLAPGKILDIPLRRLSSLRRSVFKDIIAKTKKHENVIINTHATFRWRHGLFPAIDFDQMRDINADIYINMIDGVTALHKRLSSDHSTEHTLKDLIVWREEEMICTEMLYKGINDKAPFYCLARGVEQATVETFYKLIFEQQNKRAYLSFPMTLVSEMEDVKKEINEFRSFIKESLTCFDPADLEEAYLPEMAEKAKQQGKDHIEVDTADGKTKLDVEEVRQIARDINSQIYARDFLLIDQADMIISFIPTLASGRASLSSGVERELQHAHEAGKDVYVIWTAQKRPSVFVTQTATKVFDSTAQLADYFTKKGLTK